MAECQSALGGESAKFRYQRLEYFGQRQRTPLRHQAAGFQPRHVEQASEQAGGGIQCAADLRERVLGPRIARGVLLTELLRQRLGEQMRGVQRLQQVVADRGEEAALGVVGGFRLALGLLEQRGALADALLQGFVGLQQFGLGAAERGDVGEGGDEAAARHRVAADFDDLALADAAIRVVIAVEEHALRQVRRTGTHERQPARERVLQVALVRHALQRPRRQLRDGSTHAQQRVGEAEQFGITAVPCDQAQLRVDDADALAHVLQRGFEHALVEAEILRGGIDDRGDGVEVVAVAAFAPRGIEQHPRRGRAQHGGEFALHRGFHLVRHRAGGGRRYQ